MTTTTSDFLRHLRTLAARQANDLLSDQQLLERFLKERSEASFAALVQRHGPMVLSVCRRVLHHTQDAEDAFQATFLILARKASSIRKRDSLGSWLHGVAHRSAECLRAKVVRRAAYECRLPPRPPGDAMDEITWRELRSVLDEELQRLPEKYRAPLVQCYLEARTQDEAARRLGWSKNTFGRRMNQARQLLARRLTRRGLTLSSALAAPVLIESTATAAVPPLLAASTVRAGLASAAELATGTLVPPHVAALVEGGSGTLLAKKASVVLVLLLSLTLGVGGLLAHRAVQTPILAEAPAAQPAPLSPPARSASKDKAIEIKGRVLGPDGKPFAGASVFLVSDTAAKKANTPARVTTDKDGQFHFAVKSTTFDPQGKATLAVTAKGFGPDWIEMTAENKDDVTLRLVKDDIPIEGRVLDLEGRPVADVRVRIVRIMRGDVDAWLEEMRRHQYPQLSNRISPEALGESVAAVSGKDGRFRLTGFGRDRILHVLLEGDNIERGDFEVVARPELPPGMGKGNNGVYPARFDHLAGPGKSITGTIRDKRTGKPIAGISVACPFTSSWIWATTDAQGRYRLTGIPKRSQYWVAAGGLPYFNCTKHEVTDTPGLAPVAADFKLERGVAVRGKLLDKVTGKPVRGRVSYVALPDNPNLKDFTDLNLPQALASDPGRTKADGSFAVVAIPGPGLLIAKADDDGQYLAAVLPEPRPAIATILEDSHAVVRIDAAEEEAQGPIQDLYLEPGRTLKGTVVGADDKPLAGAHFAGLSGTLDLRFGRLPSMQTESFTAGGLSPKRPRNIVFIHAEKKLAKVQKLRGDETGPLTVRLESLGAVNGRILDANGRPRTGLNVAVMLSVRREDYKDLPLELLYDYPAWSKILNREATTDAKGRFRVEGLVSGLKYLLNVKEDATIIESLTREVAVGSGKTKDLGDLKIKQPSEKGAKEKP